MYKKYNVQQRAKCTKKCSKMYKMSKYPTGSSYKMSKSPLSSKSVHHSSGNVQVSSKLASKPQTLRWYENLCPPKIWAAKELFASACMAIGQ